MSAKADQGVTSTVAGAPQADSGTASSDGSAESHDSEASRFYLPTTFAQQRLWFLDQLHPGDTSYLIPWKIRLSGDLNADALRRAIGEIVRRHEVLRTTFALADGDVMQVVAESLEVELPVVDLSGTPGAEEEAERLAAEEARQPIDLAKGPLIRIRLLRMGSSDHVLLLTLHHIIFDRWSRGILARELAALYEAFQQGRPSPLPELALQYADYAVWQRELLKGRVLDEQLAYWKRQLAGVSGELPLPLDRPRPAVRTFRGRERTFQFSSELTAELAAFCQQSGATPFMVLIGTFQALLARYTGQDDVVVGTPIFNRNRTELESIIGFFANTLALRIDLSGEPSFAEMVARSKNTALDAYKHQDLPFDRIVQEMNPERSLSHNPLVQVLFSLGNVPRQNFELPGLKIQFGGRADTTAKLDLAVVMRHQGDRLAGVIEYSTDLFDDATIERLAGHFEKFLTSGLANPGQPVSRIDFLSSEERTLVLEDFNRTSAPYRAEACFHELFEEHAAATPNAVAIVSGSAQLTWAELNGRANQLAYHLRSLGVTPDSLTGICIERSPQMIVAILGVLKAGGAYVPLDPAYPADRLAFMVSDADVRVLLTSDETADRVPSYTGRRISLDSNWPAIAEGSAANLPKVADSRNLAYVIYTSGSTGTPKGVQLEHRGLCNVAAEQQRMFGAGPGKRVLQFASTSFDASVFEIAMAAGSGATLCLGSRESLLPGPDLAGFLREQRISVVTLPPSALANLPAGEFPNLETITVAGEPCPSELIARWASGKRRFYNLYGPTEATIWSTAALCTPGAGKPVIGRPIANTRIYILDKHLQPVPIGVAGEIYIGGDGIARGYLNRPELTAERFVPNPFDGSSRLYKSGDVGRFLPDGNIDYLGRADQQVKLRGYRIEPGEIEALLDRHPGVLQSFVMVREDSPGSARLVAYVVPRESDVAVPELRKLLQQQLPEYMVPAAFHSLPALPLTPSGKVDRKALPAPDASRESANTYVAPRSPLEEKLAAIWADVLNLPRVGVRDDFFELGGHSLMAVDLFARIEKELGEKLPLGLLFDARTVAQIAERMDRQEWKSESSVRPCRTGGNRTPIYGAYGIGATVLTFRNLAKHLDPDQPIYCFEALGVDDGWNSLEELAAIYVRDMRAFQPEGPYHLLGASFGGMVVFEIARQLEAEGHEVGLVGLVDSFNIGDRNLKSRKERFDNQMGFVTRRVRTHLGRLVKRKPSQWPRYLAGRVVAIGRILERVLWRVVYRRYKTAPAKKPSILRNLTRIYHLAGMDYVPKVYPGKLVLYRGQRKASKAMQEILHKRQHGWAGLAANGLEIIDVPGDHHSMLKEPNVQALAAEITKSLAKYGECRPPGKQTAGAAAGSCESKPQ